MARFAVASPECTLRTRIATLRRQMNRSVKMPSFAHFQDRFLTTNREKWGNKTGLCFARFLFLTFESVAPANLQKCVGGFLLYKFWRIFPGIFLEDFSGTFSHKMRRKNPARKSAKKSGGPKIKIREKSVLPKTDPKICF